MSGPQALSIAANITRKKETWFTSNPRKALKSSLYSSQGSLIDSPILSLYFPSPHSFTGESVVEFHVHGNPIIAKLVFQTLQSFKHARRAEPGEFTRRAFNHGKLDLTQLEGLGDLLTAGTEAQHAQSIKQFNGSLRRLFEGWTDKLKAALAHLEAVIDFSEDEEDVGEAEIMKRLVPAIRALRGEMAGHLATGNRGEIIREGIKLAILGRPNVGKSTLLNCLSERDAAMVSDIAGTTRDPIHVALNMGGHRINIVDTAGLRETADQLEQEGIRRALALNQSAHLRLLLFEAASDGRLVEDEHTERLVTGNGREIIIVTKIDQITPNQRLDEDAIRKRFPTSAVCFISADRRLGLGALNEAIEGRIKDILDNAGDSNDKQRHNKQGDNHGPTEAHEDVLLTRERHRVHLSSCVASLDVSIACLDRQPSDQVRAAEHLRAALNELGRVVGRVDVEALLDIIFKDFCIGK